MGQQGCFLSPGENLFPYLFYKALRMPWLVAPSSISKATSEHLLLSLSMSLYFHYHIPSYKHPCECIGLSWSKFWEMVKDRKPGVLQSMGSQRVGHD